MAEPPDSLRRQADEIVAFAGGRSIKVADVLASIAALAAAPDGALAMPLTTLIWPRVVHVREGFLRSGGWQAYPWAAPMPVRQAAEAGLHRLLVEGSSVAVAELDGRVRTYGRETLAFSSAGVPFFVRPPHPDALSDGGVAIAQLGLLCSSSDGRVREAAVRRLDRVGGPEALAFLLWRTTDWVSPVALRARTAVAPRITAASVRSLMRLAPLIARLRGQSRAPVGLLDAIERRIVDEAGLEDIWAATGDRDLAGRRYILGLAPQLSERLPQVVDLVFGAYDVFARRALFTIEAQTRAHSADGGGAFRRRLATDRNPSIRAAALAIIVDLEGRGATALLRTALLDGADRVRGLAVFWLGRLEPDFVAADFYRAFLSAAEHQPPAHVAAAISALGATDRAADALLLRRFLDTGGPRIARAALKAVARLDPTNASAVLFGRLADARPGVARDAMRLLPPWISAHDAATLREAWQAAATPAARAFVALTALRMPPWPALELLLELAGTHPAEVVPVLAGWRATPDWRYAPEPPPASQLPRLKQRLEAVRSILNVEFVDEVEAAMAGDAFARPRRR